MRLDKFLNSVNLTKRRAVAQDMIKHEAVYLNGQAAKASRAVKVGDRIELRYLDSSQNYEVLKIPETKTIPKTQKDVYVKAL